MSVGWVPTAGGEGAVGLSTYQALDPSWEWVVEVKARFGPLGGTWVERLESDGAPAVHTLRPPVEALLHEAARDYVTDLSVSVVATDADGKERARTHAPPAFLAFLPDGPVVWDAGAQQRLAPAGVVSEEVRRSLGDLTGIDRVGPPVLAAGRTTVTDEVR